LIIYDLDAVFRFLLGTSLFLVRLGHGSAPAFGWLSLDRFEGVIIVVVATDYTDSVTGR